MKKAALIVILALITLNILGQSIESNNLALKVEKEDLSHKTSFAFKPKLRLKLKNPPSKKVDLKLPL